MNALRLLPATLLAAIIAAGCSHKAADSAEAAPAADVYDAHLAMVQHDTTSRNIYLIMSADSTFEGAPGALDALEARGIKANFFFTGRFMRRPENHAIVRRVIDGGHYVSGHSDQHLLYADWGKGRPVLVSPDSLLRDMRRCFATLDSMGVDTARAKYLVPPFEWIERSQTTLLRDSLGIIAINPTPGIQTYRDYTTPDMPYYWGSDSLERQLYQYEREHGLGGSFIIIHLGTDSTRTDKFYDKLPSILDSLTTLGYSFEMIN